MSRVAVGVGASRGCPAVELDALVAGALRAAGVTPAQVGVLATAEVKRDEHAVLALGAAHGWPLRFYAAAQLGSIAVPSPSATVTRHVGTPSVAEAAALLAAGAGARLIVLKQRSRHATCAIARAEGGA